MSSTKPLYTWGFPCPTQVSAPNPLRDHGAFLARTCGPPGLGLSGRWGHVDVEDGPTGRTPLYEAGTLVALPEGGRVRGTFGTVAPLVGRHRGGRLSE